MKVAIQNPFAGQPVAETELSQRIYLAARRLGWSAAEVHTATDLKAFRPDFVIALHNNSPKLAEFPTYGCMWNPPSFFEGTAPFVKHVLTYDGYLTSSRTIDRWLHQLLYTTPKRYFTAPFYTSCPATSFQPPHLDNPQLAYLGSNWDGSRFHDLFTGLDRLEFMQIYGNPEGWQHLRFAYKGALPYDGSSVLNTLNQAGVGLCVHRSEHRQTALPSMRIFEIVASGAVAICTDHPFIRSTFAETVLYIEPDTDAERQIEQIVEHMQWIRMNPKSALEMSTQAHQIFSEHYTLEKLLLGILPCHQQLIAQKGLISVSVSDRPSPASAVEYIIPARKQSHTQLHLEQLSQQTYPHLAATIVTPPQSREWVDSLLQSYTDRISFKVLESDPDYRSTALWTGLQNLSAAYFALLDAPGVIYPNHVQTLVSLLEKHPAIGVAYAGNLQPLLSEITAETPAELTAAPPKDTSVELGLELGLFQPFHLDQFLKFDWSIAPHSFIARRSLLDSVLLQDPQLNAHEALCLLLHLAQRTQFLFSYELTCEVDYQTPSLHLLQQFQDWDNELSRLKFIFWHQEFAPGKSLQSVHQAQFVSQADLHQLRSTLNTQIHQLRQSLQQSQEQLQAAQTTITAMESSKFWKLRSLWFKLKQRLGSPPDEICQMKHTR
jgi:hypothetical protein